MAILSPTLYRWLVSIPLLGRVVARLANWQYHWNLNSAHRVGRILRGRKNLSVVVVGANDGKTVDPLYRMLRRNRTWRALFIEPVPYLFERLRHNYGDEPRFRFEQVAISDRAEMRPFYYVSEDARREVPDAPSFWELLGSFYRPNLEKHLQGSDARFIVEVALEALPLAAVLERQKLERVDVLLIDTEGYDWEVLKQLDFSRYSPLVIFFEHKFLSAADKAASHEFLRDYDISDLGCDFLCQRRNKAPAEPRPEVVDRVGIEPTT